MLELLERFRFVIWTHESDHRIFHCSVHRSVGVWVVCNIECVKTFHVTATVYGSGTMCSRSTGDIEQCVPGEGHCPAAAQLPAASTVQFLMIELVEGQDRMRYHATRPAPTSPTSC